MLALNDADREGAVRRIGRPGNLIVKATYDTAEAIKPVVEDLAAALKVGSEAALDRWEAEYADDSRIASAICRPALMSEMAGQLMVQTHETKTIELARPLPGQQWLFQGEQAPAFLDLPFTEAIEMYKRMGHLPRGKEFIDIIDEYSNRSARDRTLLLRYLRKRSRELIAQLLETGGDQRAYLSDITRIMNDLGVSAEKPYYLANVYRTNVQTAYGAGRWRSIQDPETTKERPFVQFRGVRDARQSDICEAYSSPNGGQGLIFRADDPRFAHIAPPLHYQCRSAVVTYQPKPTDTVASRLPRLPPGVRVGAGFDKAPTELVQP